MWANLTKANSNFRSWLNEVDAYLRIDLHFVPTQAPNSFEIIQQVPVETDSRNSFTQGQEMILFYIIIDNKNNARIGWKHHHWENRQGRVEAFPKYQQSL